MAIPKTLGFASLATLLAGSAIGATAPTVRVTIAADKPGHAVSATMHGVFFEDINYAADGGLYAELVQNRSFEHQERLYAWSTVSRGADGAIAVDTSDPLNAGNPHYLRIAVRAAGQGFGVANSGFGGIAVRAGAAYLFSVRARAAAEFSGGLKVVLEDETGGTLGECSIEKLDGDWRRYDATLPSVATARHARLVVLVTAAGRVDLDVISLFPEKTWKDRRNGLRADLVQMLADMRPGFVRFPGGCIVEGMDLPNAYRWKDTIGDVAERKQNWNRWQHAQRENAAPQYYQTYGLGFFEYFQLCEDIGAEPVPVLNCGMACQFQSKQLVPLAELTPWIQDALDLIEFANGPVESVWGAKRAAMGHAAPFGLKYMAVGNEQWGEQYFERYRVFYDALKARHPEIQLITTSGPGVDDEWWKLAWGKFKSGTPAEIVDEHYYRPPRWFLDHADRYDAYDRKGPKVFAGEFAAHDGGRRNNLRAALAEAAFMTGLLRNSDIVVMASYAPLLAKDGATQWTPDLIWFDNTRVYGSPSYHVQTMYARNRPDAVLPLTIQRVGAAAAEAYPGRIGVGTWLAQAEFKDIEVVKDGRTLFRGDFTQGHAGWETTRGQWDVVDGALRQARESDYDARALAGDPSWADYTLSLKARQLSGREGFLIFFQVAGETGRWNIGGWDNHLMAVDGPGISSPRVPGTIETGRWYDVRVELAGPKVRCFLDGKLVHDVTRKPAQPLYAVAGRERETGEIVIMAANPSEHPVVAQIDLRGTGRIAPSARATVLTSVGPDDENSFDAPTKVAPREQRVSIAGPTFRHAFPAYSFTVLRLAPGQ